MNFKQSSTVKQAIHCVHHWEWSFLCDVTVHDVGMMDVGSTFQERLIIKVYIICRAIQTNSTNWEKTLGHLHWCEFVAHLEITVIIMPLSKRHHYIQVVLKTVDHLWHHQITGLVILQWEGDGESVCVERNGSKVMKKAEKGDRWRGVRTKTDQNIHNMHLHLN